MKGLVLVGDYFEDVEFISPIDVWKRNKDSIVIASVMKRKEVVSKSGIKMVTDTLIENVNLTEFDFLFIPGGPGAFNILDKLKIVDEVIKYFAQNHKLLCAICAAPLLLGKNGYLKNKNYTIYPGFENRVVGGNYLKQKGVVVDENYITGKSMYYSILLGLEVVKYFYGEEQKLELEKSLKGEK